MIAASETGLGFDTGDAVLVLALLGTGLLLFSALGFHSEFASCNCPAGETCSCPGISNSSLPLNLAILLSGIACLSASVIGALKVRRPSSLDSEIRVR